MGDDLDFRPWYMRADARDLLRSCAQRMPLILPCSQRYHRTVDRWATFDPEDQRVVELNAIADTHLSPILNHPVAYKRAIEAGATVTVDMAIDAALPEPRAGNVGDPHYLASLPRLELKMGHAFV